MRKIDSMWQDLHEGYQSVRIYQRKLELRWARALKVAEKRKYQREYQEWLENLSFERKRFRTVTIFSIILTLTIFLCAGISSIFSLAFGLAFPIWGTAFFILLILVGTLLIQKLVIGNLERKPPVKADASKKISDIVTVWWNRLKPPPIQIVEYGDEGEMKLLDILESKLPHDWIALHQYKTGRNLDADILVLGTNGVWLLESKFNKGTITCRNGKWMHEKRYFEEGGKEVVKRDVKRPYDQQWLAEKESIVETIMRRVPKDMRWVANEIRGGIVFTHDNITLDIDQSCQVDYGMTSYWVKKISNSPKSPKLTMDVLLHVAEAISEYASQLSEESNRQSAKQLAVAIYNKANEKEIPAFIRANI